MGPKKSDSITKGRRPSQVGVPSEDQENQQCSGKFAGDLDLCCRDPTTPYPVNIPVLIRGHLPQSGVHTGVSIAPPFISGASEEPHPSPTKRLSRGRIPSFSHSIIGNDNENKSTILSGSEPSKAPAISYKTFHLVRDSEFFRPKVFVDSTGNENEPIEQINTLYMRDQTSVFSLAIGSTFSGYSEKILPLQEQLHTLNFCFVGLNEQTISGLAEVCLLIKNLKTISLDGNPLAAEHFHIFMEKADLKITNLSLRFCKITDSGAERLAHNLGNISIQNSKLLTLTLTGNQIGDNGAKSFAKALRYNRTLISLNLSSNFITDKGAWALALVLRKIILTEEEVIYRRYLLSERYSGAYYDDMRNIVSSPSLSITSTRSRSGRDGKRSAETEKHRNRSTRKRPYDKRHRAESGDEVRPPSANRGDLKKGKSDSTPNRSSSVNSRRSEQPRASANTRGKKLTGTVTSSKKNITILKEEDEDAIDELINFQIQHIERENPLLELNEIESHEGEISLKGNLVLLNLNLSRNYLTLISANEFLLSIQHQTKFMRFNDGASFSTTGSLIEFSGLCRLELKGMNDIPIKSPVYQTLQNLLLQKSPITRFQQIKEREAKELLEQQSIPVLPPIVPEKTRSTSNAKGANQRPASRMKD